jgi:DNA-binding transcriptional regulator LsrR (DeoR family)
MAASGAERARLDDAARAGWLYYIAGKTQDEIAKDLNVSRPTAQRLVSLCLSKRLITFRLEHPIAGCMDLAARLKQAFALRYCEIVPTDSAAGAPIAGLAERAAALLELHLEAEKPVIIAIGTGRAMRAAVDQVRSMQCPNHQLVSLVGNISPDGSASAFDTVARLADVTGGRHYPMPLPLFVASDREREQLLGIRAVRHIRDMAEMADLRLVGVGQLDRDAQLHVDGFIAREELLELMRLGGVGEISGWAFDAEGRLLDGGTNRRVTSIPLRVPAAALTVGAALGAAKMPAILAAIKGRLLNGLITDESTARALLAGR